MIGKRPLVEKRAVVEKDTGKLMMALGENEICKHSYEFSKVL